MSSYNNVYLTRFIQIAQKKKKHRIESLWRFVRIYQSGNLVEFNYLHIPTSLYYIISLFYKSNRIVLLTDSLINNIFYSILLLIFYWLLNIYWIHNFAEIFLTYLLLIFRIWIDTYFWNMLILIDFKEKFS